MSHLAPWMHTYFAQALGWTLVHFLWEGAALAAVLMAMLSVFRTAPAQRRYTLACLILVLMPVAFAVTLAVIWARRPMGVVVPIPWVAVTATAGPIDISAPRFSWRGLLDRLAWLVPVWFAGVAFCYARGLAGWVSVRRMRRRGVCVPPAEWQVRVDELAARLRVSRPVALLESCITDTPVLIGYLRPMILLPLGCLTGLSVAQVECILLHELAHVARHDYVVNLLQSLVEGLLFYHPAVWWVSRVVRAERENCCDDRVVELMGDARAYAATLAVLEQRRALAPETALAATGGNLMKRIRRLTVESRGSQASVAPAFSAALLLVIFAAALTALPTKLSRARRAPAPVRLAGFAVSPQGSLSEISGPYGKWLTQDVTYIITDQERAEFQKLPTDLAREDFINQFWLKRGSEMKAEHYRRIAYVNAHFASRVNPGWETDRGRTYIVYGPPDEIDDHASGGTYQRPLEEGGGKVETYPFQQWRYRFIEGTGNNVTVEFVDPTMSGEFRMTTDPNDKVKNPYRKWLIEDVAYIITPEERVQFQGLRTDAEREQFIASFWQRRGLAFREEHYRRIAYSNEHFESGIPGWKTDLGRTYIVYGPPDIVEQMGAAAIAWTYRHIDGIGDNVSVVFENQGNGEYRMQHELGAPKQDQQAAKVFASNDRTAVSVIVPAKDQSVAPNAIRVGDVLEVAYAAANLDQAIAAVRQECAALSTGLASEHPDLLRCNNQVRALEEQRLTSEMSRLPRRRNEIEALESQLQQLTTELQKLRDSRGEDPLDGQKKAQLVKELKMLLEQYQAASSNESRSDLLKQLQAEMAAREGDLAALSAENRSTEGSRANLAAVQNKEAAIAELYAQIAAARQRESLAELTIATNQTALAPATSRVDTQVTVAADGKIATAAGIVTAAGLTPAQLAAAIGAGASVRIVQFAAQMVTVLVPLPSTRDRFHIFGEVKDNRRKIVQTFDADSTGQSALARAVSLSAGSYHLIVVMKNLVSGKTYRSELDFTAD